ncbi:MAG TPA: SAM-dependent methyltransferase [Clostridiales bacterium]|nr:SAM-dependent methyltransferase [Clostridiales bacterium]HBP51841.1 SAM-dependent methyltransferase [Clostridiales bacterium]HCH92430.1 SAM-dependent methyltransferase [Clostridiales bacterium]
MKIAPDWKDYKVIATGDGEKLEKWGNITLLRPDPQVIWHAKTPLASYKDVDAVYERSRTGGGMWKFKRNVPSEFTLSWRDLTFSLKLMGFKHTGLFPEQAVNWDRMMKLISESGREISVLNLFGYTGAASVACLKAGAKVCHVDSAKAMVERAGENVRLSGLDNSGMRYIIDDCFKFCQREIRRGRKYDAIILDPPSFGRGPNGEKWKIEEGISELCELVASLLSDDPLFVCLNSYTTGLQPTVMANILKLTLPSNAQIDADEIGLATEEGLVLPQGCTAFATFAK